MNLRTLGFGAALLLSGAAVFAANVRTDYNHKADFANFKTYSWGTIATQDQFNQSRIKSAVDRNLQADGWQLVPTGGKATVFAISNVKNEQQVESYYNGLGGGYGLGDGGWGWGGGWGGGFGYGFGGDGFGETTTSVHNQRVGHLVVDIFDASNNRLLFRGVADSDLNKNSNKNIKNLDKDVKDMLDKLPKSAKS